VKDLRIVAVGVPHVSPMGACRKWIEILANKGGNFLDLL